MSELCKLWVNGREIEADGERKLIDVLRNDLRLKSVKDAVKGPAEPVRSSSTARRPRHVSKRSAAWLVNTC